MEKSTIIRIILLVIVVAALGVGWWFFSHTSNTSTIQPNSALKTKSSEKSITSFEFPELGSKTSQAIDNASHTITFVIPRGTDITKLTPVISTSNASTISPASGAVQNFIKPVVYTITAQDGSMQSYTVTVKIATAQGIGGS